MLGENSLLLAIIKSLMLKGKKQVKGNVPVLGGRTILAKKIAFFSIAWMV